MSSIFLASPVADSPESAREKSNASNRCWIALPLVLASIALGPLLFRLGQRMWEAEHYQFFPLVLIAAAVLAVIRIRELDGLGTGHRWISIAFWATAICTAAGAILLRSPWGAWASFAVAMLAAAYSAGGGTLLKAILPIWIFVWLAVPPPMNLDQRLIVWLQTHASAWASGLLDLGGFRHHVTGVILEVPDKAFLVEEACSGIHSLFASLCAVAGFALVARRGPFWTLILLASTLFWVFCANIVRVAAVVWLSTRFGLPVAEGTPHALLGLALFALVIGMAASTDRFLLFLFPDGGQNLNRTIREKIRGVDEKTQARVKYYISERTTTASETDDAVQPARGNVRRSALAAGSVFAALLVLQFMLPSPVQASQEVTGVSKAVTLPAAAMPAVWNGWTQVKSEAVERSANAVEGQFSRIWHYQKDGMSVAVACDGPFKAWHDNEICYFAGGWNVLEATDVPDNGTGPGGTYTRLRLQRGADDHGFVLFSGFDATNRPLSPPPAYRLPVTRRFPELVRLWREMTHSEATEIVAPTYQIQLLATGFHPLDDKRAAEVEALYQEARRSISTFGGKDS